MSFSELVIAFLNTRTLRELTKTINMANKMNFILYNCEFIKYFKELLLLKCTRFRK